MGPLGSLSWWGAASPWQGLGLGGGGGEHGVKVPSDPNLSVILRDLTGGK